MRFPETIADQGTIDGGLLNLGVLRLQDALSEAQIAGQPVAFLIVHSVAVDRIDAMHGFHAGDMLSARITKTLRAGVLRKYDRVEALSRDEFACVLRPASSAGIAILAAQRVLSLFASPIDFAGRSVAADVAVGIAMFPEHGGDAGELLQHAKQALQTARGQRDRLWVYEPERDALPGDQLQCENRLRIALEQNTPTLYYQPQVDLRSGRLVGAEALLRWNDAVLGAVPPNVAVQAAESAGLIDRLTLWAITNAVQQCADFQKVHPGFSISVNVSPTNLREADLPFFIDRALRTWGVQGSSFVVEITETAMLIDQQLINEALRELKSHGVRLSIDDFGTGYSSMHHLAQLPLDELKIDLSFVRNMLEVPHHSKIVRSLIDLAHNLELSVVAEGVENEAVMTALAHLGCDHGQGYHFGKPMRASDLMACLRQQ